MAKRDFSDVMKEQLATRPTGLNRVVSEITSEVNRLAKHGATEMAHALFGGSAFTLYGEDQKRPRQYLSQGTPGHGVHGVHGATQQPEQQQERGGMEM